MTYLQMPSIYPENALADSRAQLSAIVRRGRYARSHDDTIRMLLMGDSTYTAVSGNGTYLAHAMTKAMAGLFGSVPGTMRIPHSNVNNVPYVSSLQNNAKAVVDGPAASYFPRGWNAVGLPFASGEGSYQPTWWASRHSYRSIDRPSRNLVQALPASHNGVRFEFYGLKQANSTPSFMVKWAPASGTGSSLFSTVLDSETISTPDIVEASGSDYPLTQLYRSAAHDTPAGSNPQFYLQSPVATTVSAGSGDPPAIVQPRILFNDPRGVLFDFAASGGDRIWTVIGRPNDGSGAVVADSIPMLLQCNYDVIALGFGVNDIYGGDTAADVRANYYTYNGTTNKGLIGELISEVRRLGYAMPVFVVSIPPLKIEGLSADANYATYRAQHDILAEQLMSMSDEIYAREGVRVIILNTQKISWELGFNEDNNELLGLNDRGAYSTSTVSYAVDDYYSYGGKVYKCSTAHTSSASTTPDNDTATTTRHTEVRQHLADLVHRSLSGAMLEVEAYRQLFAEAWNGDQDSAADTIASRAMNVVKPQWADSF